MKLLTETVEDVELLVEEDSSGKKSRYIHGVFMMAETKNKNGRVYPYKILEEEVNRYNKEYVETGRALGECGHPDSPSINLDRVSHMITSLKPQGNNFIGKAKILDTPMGKVVDGLLNGGVKLGVSTRGVGSLKPHNGYQLVQDDFKLATAADIVHDPSAPSALVDSIMEDVDWTYSNGTWTPYHHEAAKKLIKKSSKHEIESVALRIFENYITKVKNN